MRPSSSRVTVPIVQNKMARSSQLEATASRMYTYEYDISEVFCKRGKNVGSYTHDWKSDGEPWGCVHLQCRNTNDVMAGCRIDTQSTRFESNVKVVSLQCCYSKYSG